MLYLFQCTILSTKSLPNIFISVKMAYLRKLADKGTIKNAYMQEKLVFSRFSPVLLSFFFVYCPEYHSDNPLFSLPLATHLPPISIGTSLEPHWNLIGTSLKDPYTFLEFSIGDSYTFSWCVNLFVALLNSPLQTYDFRRLSPTPKILLFCSIIRTIIIY